MAEMPANGTTLAQSVDHALSRRERQIMDTVYSLGKATAAQVRASLPDAPGYSAVRATLRILEVKGHLHHENKGKVYVFLPVRAQEQVALSELRHVVQTFFDGSVERTISTLLSGSETKLSVDELNRIFVLIAEAKQDGAGR